MFAFRAVFLLATLFVAFVAQVSAILPLTRFMLDALPDMSEDGAADPSAAASGAGVDASTSVSTDSDVPVAAESSHVQGDSAIESSSPSSSASSLVAQANAAGHIGALGSTTVLVGSVVVGIAFAI